MSWVIIDKYRKLLASESGSLHKEWGGKLTICLVYPNHYRTAMSNLGLQSVYALLNARPDIVCERAFLPDKEELKEYNKSGIRLMSLESQRPLLDFDLLAFSVSFESDYLNIPTIFSLAGIPPFSNQRDESMPLLLAGGAALFLNPEPVAELFDLIAIGEAEPILPPLLDLLLDSQVGNRGELLRRASALTGIYLPASYEVEYSGSEIVAIINNNGVPAKVERVWAVELDSVPTASTILTPATEFADMYLLELSRGCPHGCRFCAAGFIYLPYRQRSLARLKDQIRDGLQHHQRIGLVGAAVADYRGIGELCQTIMTAGGKVSVSSLRLDSLDAEMIEVLKQSGHKTIAIAPEGGSQRLRDLIKKDIDAEQILAAVDLLISHDILNLKLYFIIGLPSETDEDIAEMLNLVSMVRERVVKAAKQNKRLGEVVLSVNPFVPKPFTPFQWCGMAPLATLEKRAEMLRQGIRGMANVRMQMESLRAAYLQALLSRGDRRLARLIVMAEETGSWKRAAKSLGIDTDSLVHSWLSLDALLPWGIIASGREEHLVKEYRRAFPLEQRGE